MFLAVFVAAIAVVGLAGAYGGSSPSTMGHSAGEIDLTPLYIDTANSNVGIGTPGPGEKLTVAGTIESTTGGVKFPDGTLQITAAVGFGSWTDKDSAGGTLVKDAIYKATSDGFVTAMSPTANSGPIIIITDSSSPPFYYSM